MPGCPGGGQRDYLHLLFWLTGTRIFRCGKLPFFRGCTYSSLGSPKEFRQDFGRCSRCSIFIYREEHFHKRLGEKHIIREQDVSHRAGSRSNSMDPP